jgi:hypothetical protein
MGRESRDGSQHGLVPVGQRIHARISVRRPGRPATTDDPGYPKRFANRPSDQAGQARTLEADSDQVQPVIATKGA